jgi:hypothetical protein
MIVMTKEEAKQAIRVWPANAKAPFDRDAQIELMKIARKQQLSTINRIVHRLNEERKEQ